MPIGAPGTIAWLPCGLGSVSYDELGDGNKINFVVVIGRFIPMRMSRKDADGPWGERGRLRWLDFHRINLKLSMLFSTISHH